MRFISGGQLMKTVVVIPALNEAQTIRGVVEEVRALGYECLVVNDGSGDATEDEAIIGGAEVISSVGNYGAGEALSWGTRYAQEWLKADIIVTFDADAQMNPADIAPAIAALDGCDLVSGNRFLGKCEGMPLARRVLLWFIYIGFWILSGREIRDPCSGLKVFRSGAFRIKSHQFAWAIELVFRVSRWGKVREVPMDVIYSVYSISKGQKTRDALKVGVEFARSVMKG
jgi:glycosyltransferase involved in cell wall biosynthesis